MRVRVLHLLPSRHRDKGHWKYVGGKRERKKWSSVSFYLISRVNWDRPEKIPTTLLKGPVLRSGPSLRSWIYESFYETGTIWGPSNGFKCILPIGSPKFILKAFYHQLKCSLYYCVFSFYIFHLYIWNYLPFFSRHRLFCPFFMSPMADREIGLQIWLLKV